MSECASPTLEYKKDSSAVLAVTANEGTISLFLAVCVAVTASTSCWRTDGGATNERTIFAVTATGGACVAHSYIKHPKENITHLRFLARLI